MQRVLHCYTCCWYDGHIDTFLDDYKASCRINSHHQKFADGDYTARSDVKTKDEIGELARAFNELAKTLKAKFMNFRWRQRSRRILLQTSHMSSKPQ